MPAASPAFVAAATAALRESAVGGGIVRTRRSGFAPVGSGWGVRERADAWIAEAVGLRCCVVQARGPGRLASALSASCHGARWEEGKGGGDQEGEVKGGRLIMDVGQRGER